MPSVDEQIALEAVAESEGPQFTPSNDQMRGMFLDAITIQQDIITHAQSMIKHYEWALSEMAGARVAEDVKLIG